MQDSRRPRRTPAPRVNSWDEYRDRMVPPGSNPMSGKAPRTPISDVSPLFDTPATMPDLERDYDAAAGVPRWETRDQYAEQGETVRFRGDGQGVPRRREDRDL